MESTSKNRPVEFSSSEKKSLSQFFFSGLLVSLFELFRSQTMSWGENMDFSGGNAGFGGDVDFSSGNVGGDFGGGDAGYSAGNSGYDNGGDYGAGDYGAGDSSYNDRPKFEPREGDWDCPE
jgi:hypothetical protein